VKVVEIVYFSIKCYFDGCINCNFRCSAISTFDIPHGFVLHNFHCQLRFCDDVSFNQRARNVHIYQLDDSHHSISDTVYSWNKVESGFGQLFLAIFDLWCLYPSCYCRISNRIECFT
ncbi:unnamed protein product, partial [Schistosoma turkestanicum]